MASMDSPMCDASDVQGPVSYKIYESYRSYQATDIEGPLVSVVVPVHNVEGYLGECLDSIIGQTLADFEVLCVDDGSTDASLEILARYEARDARVRVFQQANQGPSVARNHGLSEARGTYVCFVDADDGLAPNALERFVALAETHEADIVVCAMDIDHYGPAAPSQAWIKNRNPKRDKVFPQFDPSLLFDEPGAKPFIQRDFVRREFLAQNDLWLSDDFWMGEDTILQFEMFPKARNVVFTTDELCYYRTERDDSLMAQGYNHAEKKAAQHLGIVSHLATVWACEGYLQKWRAPFAEWAVSFFYDQFKLCGEEVKKALAREFMAASFRFLRGSQVERLTERGRARFNKVCEYGQLAATPVPLAGDRPLYKAAPHKAPEWPWLSVVVAPESAVDAASRTVGSLLEQTCDDIEVIYAGSGASDKYRQFLERVAACDQRLRVLDLPAGLPFEQAWQAGALASCGSYVMFCRDGDTLALDACNRLQALQAELPVDILQFGVNACDDGASGECLLRAQADYLPYFGILREADILNGCHCGRLYKPLLLGKLYAAPMVRGAFSALGETGADQFTALAARAQSYRGVANAVVYNHLLRRPPQKVSPQAVDQLAPFSNAPHWPSGGGIRVSFIVPVHNAAAWLGECLASIESQTTGVFEVICVDDGSTDGSLAILQDACERWTNIAVYQQPALGVSQARNTGLRHARGEYVLFVDADDMVSDRLLEKAVPVGYGLDADMTVFGFEEYWADLDRVVARRMCDEPALQGRRFFLEELEGLSTSLVTPNVWRILWKRSFIESHKLRFHADLASSEDLAFIYEALLSKPSLALVNERLYRYRRDGGLTLTRSNRGLAGYRALAYVWDYGFQRDAFSDERLLCHYTNLVLDVAEYAMGSTATEGEYRQLYGVFQQVWRPFVAQNATLIGKRYQPFWEAMQRDAADAYLFALYGNARGDLERLRARATGREAIRNPEPPLLENQPAKSARRYARAILVGSFALGDASVGWRAVEALRAQGHAVLPLDSSSAHAAEALSAALRTFRPTVVLYGDGGLTESLDPQLDEILRVAPVPVVVLDPAGPDVRYWDVQTARPEARGGAVCLQSRTPKRERLLRDVSLETYDVSWPNGIESKRPGTNPAHYLRTKEAVVYFADGNHPHTQEVALRIAEGNVVLCEDGAQHQVTFREGLRDRLVVFSKGRSEDAIAFLADRDAVKAAREAQVSAVRALEPMDAMLERKLREVDAGEGHTVLVYEDPAVSVGLYGWFGAHNFGDNLLMALAVRRLEDCYPNLYPWLIGAKPNVIQREYGYEAYQPGQKYEIARALRGSGALAYCGGLIFDEPMASTAGDCEFILDPWIEPSGQAAIALLAQSCGVRPVLFGGGAGPVGQEATRTALRLMGMADMLFLCRDQHSCELVEEAGVAPELVRLRADLAYGCRKYIEAEAAPEMPIGLEPGSYFMVSLRRWSSNPPDFAAKMAAAIDGITSKTGLRALFVPFDADDVRIHREVVGAMWNPACAEVLDERPAQDELFALLRGSSLAVAMRLHCSILHHVLGKPAVGLDYDDKVAAHFAFAGQTAYLLGLDASAEVVERTAVEAWCHREQITHDLWEPMQTGARLVDVATQELRGVIDRAPRAYSPSQTCYPRTIGRHIQRLTARDLELSQKQDECERLSRELEVAKSVSVRLQERCAQLTRDHDAAMRRLRAECDGLAKEVETLQSAKAAKRRRGSQS